MSNTDSESDDVVFLSPPESVQEEMPNTGASPTLRRSSRKRKSISTYDMSKNSGKKKKASSPEQIRCVPKIPRMPQGQDPAAAGPGAGTGDRRGPAADG